MRLHLPPWLKALTAEPGSREADFDWGEWAANVFREMRRNWVPYFVMVGLFVSMFSCADAQFEPHLEASAKPEKPHDPWAIEKPAGGSK